MIENKETRRGPGRPRKMATRLEVRVNLTPEDVEIAKKIGEGNISEGIRKALRMICPDPPFSK